MFDEFRTANLLLRGIDELDRRKILEGRATWFPCSILWWLFPEACARPDKGAR